MKGVGYYNFSGGRQGSRYADLLCPVGYRREYLLNVSRTVKFKMDFALVERKVNVEIDGPYHMGNVKKDTARDTFLKQLGWIVIRVNDPSN
jgi:very-short-patch-repair endonuclease